VNVRLRSASFYDSHPFPYYIGSRFTHPCKEKTRPINDALSNFDSLTEIGFVVSTVL